MSSAICYNLDQSKILWSGNGKKPQWSLKINEVQCLDYCTYCAITCLTTIKNKNQLPKNLSVIGRYGGGEILKAKNIIV